jgi:hypothetical protein
MIGYNKIIIVGYVGSDITVTATDYLFKVRIPFSFGGKYKHSYISCVLKKTYFKKPIKKLPIGKGDSIFIEGSLKTYTKDNQDRYIVSIIMFSRINNKEENSLINSMRHSKNVDDELDEDI